MPLSTDLKKDLRDAVLTNRMDTFYANWGNHVVFGFTRGVLKLTTAREMCTVVLHKIVCIVCNCVA